LIFELGSFELSPFEGLDESSGIRTYSLSVILEQLQQPAMDIDIFLAGPRPVTMMVDIGIFQPLSTYLTDIVLILDRNDPRFQESIINAALMSYARLFEDLSISIQEMGSRFTLPNASTEDLDDHWSKLIGLKRRYGESDSSFKDRLATELAIIKSSGTRDEIKSIINHILGTRDAVDLNVVWPAELRLKWKSFNDLLIAQDKYDVLKEAMDKAIMAGVSWSTRFPYIQYSVDALLEGIARRPFQVDLNISGKRSESMLVRMDIFEHTDHTQLLDIVFETLHRRFMRVEARFQALHSVNSSVKVGLEAKLSKTQSVDYTSKAKKPKNFDVDLVNSINRLRPYKVDLLAEHMRRGFCLVAVNLEASA
jgi:hypothetical protein